MERERQLFHRFLSMHAHKATSTNEPTVHIQFYTENLAYNSPLLLMDSDDICTELDPTSDLVRWLLQQLGTYDCTKQRIVALIFDRRTVLSEVLRCV